MRWLVFSLIVLSTAAGAGGAEPPPDQRLVVGRLPCAQPWDGRSHGWRQLGWELMKRTSAEAELEMRAVDPASDALYRTPLLVWSCPEATAMLGERALANLRRHLKLGGMLWIDDPRAEPGGAFDRSVRRILDTLFPQNALQPIAWDHVLFKTFFLVTDVAGRERASDRLLGVTLDERLAVVYSQNDMLGAVSRDLYGAWEFAVEPGGELQRERTFQLGINLIYYALCLDYKDDRVHLPFILKRRRL
jgi:hypothetical protein